MGESEQLSASEEAEDSYTWMNPLSSHKGIKIDKKRRFSEAQVKSLELMFETQTKLEPRQKLQLARELQLHPKQVSIWFQNKRARWKSKQLEKEYSTLRADYDALLSSFESLKNEKQVLENKLKKLLDILDNPMERGVGGEHIRVDQGPNLTMISERTKMRSMPSSDNEENRYSKLSEKEEDLFGDSPLGSSFAQFEQQFCSYPSDQTCAAAAAASLWWELWPVNE